MDFVEHCVTRLTKEDQATLFLLHDTLKDEDKIRVLYLVLGYGWDFVLTEICVGDPNCYNDLPLFNMTKEQFKTKYVVDVNVIIQRSTTLYGKYSDKLKQDPKLFVREAKGVGKMIRMEDNDDDNDGDQDGGGVGDVGESGGGGDNDDDNNDEDDNDDNKNDDGFVEETLSHKLRNGYQQQHQTKAMQNHHLQYHSTHFTILLSHYW